MQRTLCVSSICSRLYDASTSGIVCQEFSCPMWGFACSHDSSCSSCAFPGAKEMDIVFVCEQHPSGGKARGCCTCQDACCKQALQLSGSKVFHHDNECFMYREETPATLDFKVMEGSMYNTPAGQSTCAAWCSTTCCATEALRPCRRPTTQRPSCCMTPLMAQMVSMSTLLR